MRTKYFISGLFALLVGIAAYAQNEEYATGLLPDDSTYDKLPIKAELLTRDYTILPSSHSLIQYCPAVRSQSHYQTCAGWASAYAARTIAEAIKYDWTDKDKITREAFSPLFIYALVKDKKPGYSDDNCQNGAYTHMALEVMKNQGVPKLSAFNVMCANYVSEDLKRLAQAYKIDDYFTLFRSIVNDGNEKVRKVKKSISEDCPVIISMELPQSFHSAKETWNGQDVDPSKHGRHAMCVVGYDDNKQGGAFCVMNSWGPNWGDNGFVWIKYDDFAKFVYQAFEIYVRKMPKPQPQPQPQPDPKVDVIKTNRLAGKLELQLSTGEMMKTILQHAGDMSTYKMEDSYISGTRYRLYISNNEPAYVYVIGSDLTGNISKVFPPKNNISAALTYKSNHIAIPDERYYIEMDQTVGTDYMCVLYSKEPLDINAVINQINKTNGSLYEKIQTALKNQLIRKEDIKYQAKTIEFQAESQQTIVPIIVEIPHK